MANEIARLNRRLESLAMQVRGLSGGPQLAFSSLEDGSIQEYDEQGNPVASYGKQFDGSHVAAPFVGPIPPTPVAATVIPGPGVMEVRWNGKFAGGEVSTLDWSHASIYVGTDPGFEPDWTAQVSTLRGELGDMSLLQYGAGTYYVRLASWSKTGKHSPASPAVAVTVFAAANVDSINLALEAIDSKAQQAQDDALAADAAAGAASSAAIAADAKAQQAKDDAFAAAGIANGKGKVLVQSTAPAAADRNAVTLWIDTTGGANTPKRWTTGTTWVAVTDKAATDAATAAAAAQAKANKAESDAAAAQDAAENALADAAAANTAAGSANSAALAAAGLANSKGRVIYQSGAPTGIDADEKNLWIRTSDNKPHTYTGGTWTAVTDKAATDAATAAAAANSLAASKVTTFYGSSTPTATATGDLWLDSGNGNALKRWSGSAWTAVSDAKLQEALTKAGDAQATADGKIKTYAQISAPTGLTTTDAGDLWIDTDDGNKMWRWSGTAWAAVQDSSIATAQAAAQAAAAEALAASGIAVGKGKVWTQDTAPPVGTEYLWAGTAHASASIKKVNGVEVRRNILLNPSSETTRNGFGIAPGTSGIAATTSSTDTPKVGSIACRQTWSVGSTTGSAGLIHTLTTGGAAGAVVSGRVSVRSSGAKPISMLFRFRMGSTVVGSKTSTAVTLPAGQWVDFEVSNVVATGTYDNIQMYALITNGTVNSPGDWIEMDGLILEYAATAGDYFDGSSLSDRGNDLWIDTTAGANTPKRWSTGNTWVAVTDKVAIDAANTAANAVSAAAAAQSKADAAFTAATNAATAAGNAQASANGKNNVYYMAALPSGTGFTVGDTVFIRSAVGQPVTATHQWDGSAWILTTLGHQVLASVDLGKATVGELDGVYIKARTVSLETVLIGSLDNLVPDPGFTNKSLDWGNAGGVYSFPTTEGRDGKSAFKIGPSAAQTGKYSRAIPATGGESYRTTVWVKSDVAVPAGALAIYRNGRVPGSGTSTYVQNLLKQTGGAAGNDPIEANKWTKLSVTDTLVDGLKVPLDIANFSIGLFSQASFSTGTVWWSDITCTRMGDGNLVLDGAMDAKSITGAVIKTNAAANRGIELNGLGGNNYIRAWDAAGAKTVDIDGNTGIATITGLIQTALTGVRVELSSRPSIDPLFGGTPSTVTMFTGTAAGDPVTQLTSSKLDSTTHMARLGNYMDVATGRFVSGLSMMSDRHATSPSVVTDLKALSHDGAYESAINLRVDGKGASTFREISLVSAGIHLSGDIYTYRTLRIYNDADAGPTSVDHPFQIGDEGGLNVAFDNNEVVARNAGTLSNLNVPGGITVDGQPTAGGHLTRKDYVDAQTYGNSVDITPSASNTPTSRTVTFPAGRFKSTPTVVATAVATVPGTVVTGVAVTSVSTTGCTIWLTRTSTTTTTVNFVAIAAG